MSTALLHYGANERKHLMLEKLGGKEVLAEATDRFYDRQVHDARLLRFFHGTDLSILKWHQFNLMSIAFTAVPKNFDVVHLILKRHQKLFDQGLDETYFDVVMEHFVKTLEEMEVSKDVINDAVHVIRPLRDVFVQGAEEARKRAIEEKKKLWMERVAIAVVIGAGPLIYFVSRRKSSAKH